MTADHLDISDSFTWDEDLPRPQWDLLATWVETRVELEEQSAGWTAITRQWLEKLAEALGRPYAVAESAHFLLLAPQPEPPAEPLLRFAHHCRKALLAALPGAADFKAPGKQAVVMLRNSKGYYKYLSVYYPEGHHGSSAGVHVREGYP